MTTTTTRAREKIVYGYADHERFPWNFITTCTITVITVHDNNKNNNNNNEMPPRCLRFTYSRDTYDVPRGAPLRTSLIVPTQWRLYNYTRRLIYILIYIFIHVVCAPRPGTNAGKFFIFLVGRGSKNNINTSKKYLSGFEVLLVINGF